MSEYYRVVRHSGIQKLFRIAESDFWVRIKASLLDLLPAKGNLAGNADKLGNSCGLQIIDPLHTEIIAPPKPATPITRLPDEQLVTRSTKPYV